MISRRDDASTRTRVASDRSWPLAPTASSGRGLTRARVAEDVFGSGSGSVRSRSSSGWSVRHAGASGAGGATSSAVATQYRLLAQLEDRGAAGGVLRVGGGDDGASKATPEVELGDDVSRSARAGYGLHRAERSDAHPLVATPSRPRSDERQALAAPRLARHARTLAVVGKAPPVPAPAVGARATGGLRQAARRRGGTVPALRVGLVRQEAHEHALALRTGRDVRAQGGRGHPRRRTSADVSRGEHLRGSRRQAPRGRL